MVAGGNAPGCPSVMYQMVATIPSLLLSAGSAGLLWNRL